MTKAADLYGKRFGRLVVIDRAPNSAANQTRWRCQCDCGGLTVVAASALKSGDTQSCTCLMREAISKRKFKHGRSHSSEHRVWCNMIRRCSDPNYPDFHRYGARGISVCERWQEFSKFFEDMGKRPAPGLTIERRDNNGPYSPANCYWGTMKQQSRNRRSNHMVSYKGQHVPLIVALEMANSGIAHSTARARLKRGWSVQAALETPVPV